MPMSAEVRTLDSGYDRETRSLLYHAYRHEPTFAYLFEADRPGYQQRVRATVRELVNQHFLQQQPALGLLLNDRLIAVALIAPPQRRLDITESWAWRARMLLTAGFAARGATWITTPRCLPACPAVPCTCCRCLACTRSSRASIMASSCWKQCMSGAPRTKPPRAWSSTPATRAT